MNKKILKCLLIAFILFSAPGHAQDAPGDESDQGNLEGTDTPATPIDSNILLLGATGLTVAFYSVQRKKV